MTRRHRITSINAKPLKFSWDQFTRSFDLCFLHRSFATALRMIHFAISRMLIMREENFNRQHREESKNLAQFVYDEMKLFWKRWDENRKYESIMFSRKSAGTWGCWSCEKKFILEKLSLVNCFLIASDLKENPRKVR